MHAAFRARGVNSPGAGPRQRDVRAAWNARNRRLRPATVLARAWPSAGVAFIQICHAGGGNGGVGRPRRHQDPTDLCPRHRQAPSPALQTSNNEACWKTPSSSVDQRIRRRSPWSQKTQKRAGGRDHKTRKGLILARRRRCEGRYGPWAAPPDDVGV